MQTALQRNLSKILEERQVQIPDAERRAGMNTNTIRHILTGSSKNPSLNTIKAIADSLDTTVDALMSDLPQDLNATLNQEKLELFEKIVSAIINYLIKNKLSDITFMKINQVIQEVYLYSIDSKPFVIDSRFIEWSIKKHTTKK